MAGGTEPRAADLMYDTRTKRVGVVMDTHGECYWLRPPRGGIEWHTERRHLRPATVSDRLRESLTELNERSSNHHGGATWQ
jgi:hypothetical protein